MLEFNNVIHYSDGMVTIETTKYHDNGDISGGTIELNKKEYQKWRILQGYNKKEPSLQNLSDINKDMWGIERRENNG